MQCLSCSSRSLCSLLQKRVSKTVFKFDEIEWKFSLSLQEKTRLHITRMTFASRINKLLVREIYLMTLLLVRVIYLVSVICSGNLSGDTVTCSSKLYGDTITYSSKFSGDTVTCLSKLSGDTLLVLVSCPVTLTTSCSSLFAFSRLSFSFLYYKHIKKNVFIPISSRS